MNKMNSTYFKRFIPLLGFLAFALPSYAQEAQQESGLSTLVLVALVTLAIAVVFAVVVLVSDNLIRIRARQIGADKGNENFSVFPSMREIAGSKSPEYVNGSGVVTLRKGHDILLEGNVENTTIQDVEVNRFAVQPPNFRGIAPIPKMDVEVGAEVKAGDPIFHDKGMPDVKFVAPVSGEVVALNRGPKRAIHEVVILADKEIKYRELPKIDLEKASREELVEFVKDSGAWPLIMQRPYNIIAEPDKTPRDIFISTFNSAPLAPQMDVLVDGREDDFQKGLDLLSRLTSGKVYLGLNAGGDNPPHAAFRNAEGVEKRWFRGPHPAGNVGIQIHHIAPISSGNDVVWTLRVQDVITLGALLTKGRYDVERVITVAGGELKEPQYVRTFLGASIDDLVKDNLKNDNVRFISGDILSGNAKGKEQFLDAHSDLLTIAAEGDYYETFGWLIPSKLRPTLSKTYPNFLLSGLRYQADTNTHGERRAFVVTGQYEDVLPMDIYLQHIMKSILINDFERMEGLGIHELVEEDIALCEFACTSKQPLQQILREGLDLMHEQG
jgi:Na+-transporting NADH:ubiquinone oxidoreductase subunit A